jgi:hypothetical protein
VIAFVLLGAGAIVLVVTAIRLNRDLPPAG